MFFIPIFFSLQAMNEKEEEKKRGVWKKRRIKSNTGLFIIPAS